MEILGGYGKGMTLKVPPGMEVRPTSVRTRRAFFDMLGDLSGKVFCDLFAGSGGMGLEAASRGAGEVIFMEKSARVLSVVRENVRNAAVWSADTQFHIHPGTVPGCLDVITRSQASPDIVFGDPPYAESVSLLDRILRHEGFSRWAQGSTFYWEMPSFRTDLKVFPDSWRLEAVRDFGSSRFLVIRKKL
jgi:16S rRNA (guanine(966)-N(2))-methyltransferase RsmD